MKLSSSKQIGYGAVISYIGIALNIVAGLLVTPWIVKTIGQSDYALYTLAHSLMSLFVIDFGLSAAVTKFVSQYHAEGREDKAERFLHAVYRLYLMMAAVIFMILVVLFFFLDDIYTKLSPSELEKFKVVYIIAGLFSVVSFPFVMLNGVLNAYERFVQIKLADVIYRFLTVLLTAIALLTGIGLYGVVAASSVSGLVMIVYKLSLMKKETHLTLKLGRIDKDTMRTIFSFSFWTMLSTIAGRLIFNIMPSILGAFSSTEAIAVFGVVTTVEGYSYILTSAINGMFMPRISSIYASRERTDEKLLSLTIKVGRFQFALNGLLVVGFALVGKSFLTLWVGEEYLGAYLGILLVMIPGLFYNSLEVANTSMLVRNKVHLPAIVSIVIGICNVLLSLLLVPRYGALGACISICIAYMIRAVLYTILHQTVMKIDMKRFVLHCYVRMSIPLIGTFLVGMLLNEWLTHVSWMYLLVKALLIGAVYLVFCLMFGLQKEERKRLWNKISPR